MRIQTLSTHVSNQIAAGEVIERPASVVKELLENALDAGAKQIDVEIGFGGLNQIKVSDDGAGILKEDLPLAIAPHATSKLKALDDLYVIDSMGFRGEALASISAVARILIQSRAATEQDAMALESDEHGMRLLPSARQTGTTIEVRDLFFNAPVRKKFLKSPEKEYQAIEAVMKRLVFSWPEVAFKLSHNGKPSFELPPALSERAKRMRLTKLLGKAFVDDAIQVDMTRGEMRLHGFLSGPQYARSQQDKIWFYINQRMVRDKLILHALRQAYADVLPEGRYPACVLFLTLPRDAVDINVHPSKYEVRFSDARAVHDLIRLLVAEMLQHHAPKAQVMHLIQDSVNAGGLPLKRDDTELPLQALNERFALWVDQKKPYLLDVRRLHQLARLDELHTLPKPFATRPLLVPVMLDFSQNTYAYLLKHQVLLQSFGILFDVVEAAYALKISAIPCALPGLDLRDFFTAFACLSESDIADPNTLLQVLVEAETAHWAGMTKDEQKALLLFFEKHAEQYPNLRRCLDINSCEKVFDCA